MTKLEEEILAAQCRTLSANELWKLAKPEVEEQAKAAADVAKRYIEKAFDELSERVAWYGGVVPDKERWLKENGIVANDSVPDRDCECFPGSKCDSIGECKQENGIV